MGQIERIQGMEQILVAASAAVQSLSQSLDDYEGLKRQVISLSEYYQSGLWHVDWSDDRDGKLPHTLKRGVLSEDAIYDLLTDWATLESRIETLSKSKHK
jgi:hypothetical protein